MTSKEKSSDGAKEQTDSKRCADCGGELLEGFVPTRIREDDSFGEKAFMPMWYPGKAKYTFNVGRMQKPPIPHQYVTAWRCAECGLLKFYANPKNWRPVTEWKGKY